MRSEVSFFVRKDRCRPRDGRAVGGLGEDNSRGKTKPPPSLSANQKTLARLQATFIPTLRRSKDTTKLSCRPTGLIE